MGVTIASFLLDFPQFYETLTCNPDTIDKMSIASICVWNKNDKLWSIKCCARSSAKLLLSVFYPPPDRTLRRERRFTKKLARFLILILQLQQPNIVSSDWAKSRSIKSTFVIIQLHVYRWLNCSDKSKKCPRELKERDIPLLQISHINHWFPKAL